MKIYFYKSLSNEAKLFSSISLLLFVFLLFRLFSIPLYVDEVTTIKYYIKPAGLTPFGDYMRANNHLVNTILAKFTSHIFGDNLFGFRLPNLLSFIIFSFYTYKLGGFIKDQFIRWGFYLSMLLSLNIIVFFALSRGYGLSFAFIIMASYHLLMVYKKPSIKQLFFILLSINLALFSNLTLLLPCFLISGFVLIQLIKNKVFYFSKVTRLKSLVLIPLHLFFTGFAVHILLVYKEAGLLWWGNNIKTWKESLATVLQSLFGLDSNLLVIEIILLVLVIIMVITLFFAKKRKGIIPFYLFFGLLFLSITGVLVLHQVLAVNYPYQRTGAHFYLLFVLSYFFAINTIDHKAISRFLSLPALLIVFHFIINFNFDKVVFWQNLTIQDQVFDKVSSYEKEERISSAKIFGVARFNWMYTKFAKNNVHLPMSDYTNMGKNFYFDYVLDTKESMKGIEPLFDSLLSQKPSDFNLYKRKQPLKKKLIAERKVSTKKDLSSEYYEFLRLNIDSNQNSTFNIELSIALETNDYPFQSFLVFATEDTDTKEKYELKNIDLDANYYWEKDFPLLMNGFIFDTPKDKNITVIVYLWNQKKVDYTIYDSEIKLFKVEEEEDFKVTKN